MYSRGIRGAITVNNDTADDIKNAVINLFSEIRKKNEFKQEDISHIIFTMTKDIKSAFPAKFFRENFNAPYVPMLCMNELEIEPSLKM